MSFSKSIVIFCFTFLSMPFAVTVTSGGGPSETCTQIVQKVEGDNLVYSLNSHIDNPLYFANIGCALQYRTDLCAMEMSEFDLQARVYDYYTRQEISFGEAFFVVDQERATTPGSTIVTFADRQAAEKYAADKGRIVTFNELIELSFQ